MLRNLLLLCALAHAETVYIQSLHADLRTSPAMNAPLMVRLNRGTALQITKHVNGLWLEATVQGKKGYITRLFVSDHKPIGAQSLVTDVKQNINARRRSSSYAASASTRGLASTDRIREGRASPANAAALEAIEKEPQPTPQEIERFGK